MSYWEASGKSNDWFTPPEVFEALGCRFDLDVAHPANIATHVPTDRFYSEAGLERPWDGFVWMNPPFGGRNGLTPWMDRFFEHRNGIALTPDRTSAPWFQSAWPRAEFALFTPKLKFISPDGSRGASPSNGTTLWGCGDRANHALIRAAALGFGILAEVKMRRAA